MTKLEIAQALSAQSGMPLSDAIHATDGIIEVFKKCFATGNNIYLRGFGTFKIIERKAKKVRNIKESSSFICPAKNTVKFIPSNQLTIKK